MIVLDAPFLLPTIYTPALSERYESDGPKLRGFVKLAWKTTEHPQGIVLDEWQAWLLDRMLERYPCDHPDPEKAGRLRYRQIVVSIPRQNGKSVLGAILALYGLLLHEQGPTVVGVAHTADSARIVYNRVLFVIQSNANLKSRFSKMTETRGIKTKDGTGTYEIKASKGDALQGIPASMSIVDELHITAPAIWQSLVNGTLTRADGLVAGITTAGDDDSALLKQLYELGMKAADGDPQLERFGFFCWQAPEPIVPKDDEALTEWLLSCNPSLYEAYLARQNGKPARIIMGNVIADVRGMAEQDVVRYRGNLFVASQSAFIPVERFKMGERGAPFPTPLTHPGMSRPVFSIDRTPDWGAATITANVKIGDEIHTEVVASIVRPDLEQLVEVCLKLWQHSPQTYIMDGFALRDLGAELKRRGLPAHIATQGDILTASSMFFAKIMAKKVKHSNDELLSRQIPLTVRKNVNNGFRISRADSSDIDAVMSTALGVFGAETARDIGQQVF